MVTTSKIDSTIIRGGAHTQQDLRQKILELTGTEPQSHVSTINCARLKYKNEDIIQ